MENNGNHSQKSITVFLTPVARKQLHRLPRQKRVRIDKKISLLLVDPLVGKFLQGELFGLRVVRVWPYRIIYHFRIRDRVLEIMRIEHRQSVYKRR